MIDRKSLLAELQKLVSTLEDDLRERSEADESVMAHLRDEWQRAKNAARTADTFTEWRDGSGSQSGRLTEVAAAWVLACVFVRFLEDNDLISLPRLGGPGERMQLARDERTAYAQREPLHNDAQYLEWVFKEAARLPALAELLGDRHNPLWTLRLGPDGGKALLSFWQQRDDATGAARWDFTDRDWDTRFLGDLYQDLSESARKRYALLQTPDFIEEFILDRTLDPACEEFGYREVRMIDPACGSGHFLLGSFERLFRRWAKDAPGENPTVLAQKALDAVHGVDINPFAAGIARFRLLVAAAKASHVTKLRDAPAFHVNVTTGDSLLHGPVFERSTVRVAQRGLADWLHDAHMFETEDPEALRSILGQRYHVVVGNPPYIAPADAALSARYRERFGSCSGKYALSVPFMERLFDLAIAPNHGQNSPSGFVGQITSNSFMKREFGQKLAEEFVPRWDISHVIDMAGAYVPGHGTPTVILLGRHRPPVTPEFRAVLGIRGEPGTPADPSRGLVWSAIKDQIDRCGSESAWVSVADQPRSWIHQHPWRTGGGGAAELSFWLDAEHPARLAGASDAIGITAVTGEDDLYVLDVPGAPRRLRIERVRPLVEGDIVRDWSAAGAVEAVWLYDETYRLIPLSDLPSTERLLWTGRAAISRRRRFGTPMLDRGLTWYEWQELYTEKLRTSLTIAFAFVATHNHFVLDRGGKVFKQSAPVIKLPLGATEDDHLGLLGLLNCSAACFWLKQVCHNKGSTVDSAGARQRTDAYEDFFEFTGTKLLEFPLPSGRALALGAALDRGASDLQSVAPSKWVHESGPSEWDVALAKGTYAKTLARLIALQEELDWRCYALYCVTAEPLCFDGDPPPVSLGQRAFEIVMARKIAAGELETRWFERHGSTPTTEVPAHWPKEYRLLVERRIREIESTKSVRLIEQPEYKRRWNVEPWDKQLAKALREWILERLEDKRYWPEPALQSCSRLADRVRHDAEFLRAAELYTGRADYDVATLVESLLANESVPFLAAHRYKASGLRKRAAWERTWDLQRAEDAIDARTRLRDDDPRRLSPDQAKALRAHEIGDIDVPPKYATGDFQSSSYWPLRGKLDVPKQRFVAYPGAERDVDGTLVVTWAGFDHLQQATAVATYYVERKDKDGWTKEKLMPLLAGILELQPWLLQWHNEIDVATGQRPGEEFQAFLDEEARALGVTMDDLRGWKPEAKTRGRKKKGA